MLYVMCVWNSFYTFFLHLFSFFPCFATIHVLLPRNRKINRFKTNSYGQRLLPVHNNNKKKNRRGRKKGRLEKKVHHGTNINMYFIIYIQYLANKLLSPKFFLLALFLFLFSSRHSTVSYFYS